PAGDGAAGRTSLCRLGRVLRLPRRRGAAGEGLERGGGRRDRDAGGAAGRVALRRPPERKRRGAPGERARGARRRAGDRRGQRLPLKAHLPPLAGPESCRTYATSDFTSAAGRFFVAGMSFE